MHNIRVTVIEPGAVATELTEHITNPTAKQETQQWYHSMHILRSEDIAAGILYAVTQPAYARAGALVQVFHRGKRPLEKFDPELVAQLVQTSRELGIEVHLNKAVTAIERQSDHLLVHAGTGEQDQVVEADLVVHAAGRVPEIDDLDPDAGGVACEKGGVTVNSYLQSVTNAAVYAAGDAVASGRFPLTPVAAMQGDLVARNLLEGNQYTPNYTGIPSEEVINVFALARRTGLRASDLKSMVYAYPTSASDVSYML